MLRRLITLAVAFAATATPALASVATAHPATHTSRPSAAQSHRASTTRKHHRHSTARRHHRSTVSGHQASVTLLASGQNLQTPPSPTVETPSSPTVNALSVSSQPAESIAQASSASFATAADTDRAIAPGVTPQTLVLPAPTYYVSPTGAASLSDTSSIDPMSLQEALTVVPSGAVVQVASGSYPAVVDFWIRTSWVTFTGAGDATAPSIAGIDLWGAQYVRFANVEFTGEVYINYSPYTQAAQPSENIALINSEINCGTSTSAPAISSVFTQAIYLRGASQNVEFSGDYVHNCTVGFGSQAQDPLTTNVSITYSTFQDF